MLLGTKCVFRVFTLSRALEWVSLVAQLIKKKKKIPHAMQETQVQSLGWEVSLEKKMPTHSSILAGRIPWTEEPGGPQSWT